MNYRMLTVLLGIFSLLFSSCDKVDGEGPLVAEPRNVRGFSAIRSEIDGDVYVTQGSSYRVTVEAQHNILDMIETNMRSGELSIYFNNHKKLGRHSRITVYVSCPDINGLAVNGSGYLTTTTPVSAEYVDMQVWGSGGIFVPDLNTHELHAFVSGSGSIESNGVADYESLEISGSGQIDLLYMLTPEAETMTSGSGDMKVNVSELLNAQISGSGNVYYKGRPHVNAHVSGSGRVLPW